MVRHDLQPAVGDKDALNQRHEFRLDQPPFVVTRLRPRVGEINMENRERFRRNKLGEEERSFRPHSPGIGAVMPAHAVRSIAPKPARPFNPKKIGVGTRAGLFGKKGALAHADFEFNRVGIAIKRFPVEGFGEGFDVEADGFDDEGVVGLHEEILNAEW